MQDNSFIALGTAGDRPSRLRSTSGSIFMIGGETWLIDPGEGTLRGLIYMAINPSQIDHIHLTRINVNTCMGLPALLNIMPPEGLRKLALSFPEANRTELEALRAFSENNYFPENIYPLKGVLEEMSTPRRNRVLFSAADAATPSYGMRIEPETGPAVAILAEGRPSDAASLLIADTAFCVAPTRYLKKHSAAAEREKALTASEAATLARDANVGHLAMTGFSHTYELANGFLHEASPIFPNCDYAQDLQIFTFT